MLKNKVFCVFKSSIKSFTLLILMVSTTALYAADGLINLFPIEHYDQNVSTWINPNSSDYDKPLLSNDMQQKRFELFMDHYFGIASPWNDNYVIQILRQGGDLKILELKFIADYSNEGKEASQMGYGENFRPYDKAWINTIAENMNVAQFGNLIYQKHLRAIATDNLPIRALPTNDPHFYDHNIAGQGYPFDNLQVSALWAGTPVYILGETRDHAWFLILSPDCIGWVSSSGIAYADHNFINVWTKLAKNKLVAITHTQTNMVDTQGHFLFKAYIGSVFPATSIDGSIVQLLAPIKDEQQHAVIKYVVTPAQNAELMPVVATPHQFANILQELKNRPYGWGNMYFYNDCSAELKSLFTPFAIWLPRHSSDQVASGHMIDMSFATPEARMAYLAKNGKPFLTIVYVGGHVFLYVGNFNINSSKTIMTYQDVWGLKPKSPDRRAVIGESVFFPLMLQYPEDTTLLSHASRNYFQVSYLNELPDAETLLKQNTINIKNILGP